MKKESSKKEKSAAKDAAQLSRVADMPMGLSFSLSRNVNAMTAFCAMSDEKRQSIIEGARAVSSKQEMKEYVNAIAKDCVGKTHED